MNYYPKRPVKSFQDLQVYQTTYGLAVEIVKRINKDATAKTKQGEIKKAIIDKLFALVLAIPIQIATAHSKRFAEPDQALAILEEVMLNCNLSVVYLEQYRDLVNPIKDTSEVKSADTSEVERIETDFFEEQIKEYLRVRGKILRLQIAWKKFMDRKNE